jgi:hypothetical protein
MHVVLMILVPILGYVAFWLQIHLDYRNPWKDRRTRLHKLGFMILKSVVPLAIVGTVFLAFYEDRARKNDEARLSSMGSTLDRIAIAVGTRV